MNSPKLSPRLLAAAGFVRNGSFAADIGTDHAYLPIYLCSSGRIIGAVASDINEGPVARALINVADYHLTKKITVLRADGLSGIEEYRPNDIMICGMGGELITEIIKSAEWTRDKKIRLILQPMTHADKLRAYLLENGYSIVDEAIVKDDKIYQIICAEYAGNVYEYSPVELIFGRHNIARGGEVFYEYAAYVKNVFLTRKNGKLCSGADVSEECFIIDEIDKLLKVREKGNDGN